jgi:hypothetical protein
MKQEKLSYMMLFCALMLVRNSRATVEQSVSVVPLHGKAKRLAGELAS